MRLFLSDRHYKEARFLVGIVLPAFGTFYFALSQLWGLPDSQQILGTILALQAFLGVCLRISTKSYEHSGVRYSGTIKTTEAADRTHFWIEPTKDPHELQGKSEAVFKISPSESFE